MVSHWVTERDREQHRAEHDPEGSDDSREDAVDGLRPQRVAVHRERPVEPDAGNLEDEILVQDGDVEPEGGFAEQSELDVLQHVAQSLLGDEQDEQQEDAQHPEGVESDEHVRAGLSSSRPVALVGLRGRPREYQAGEDRERGHDDRCHEHGREVLGVPLPLDGEDVGEQQEAGGDSQRARRERRAEVFAGEHRDGRDSETGDEADGHAAEESETERLGGDQSAGDEADESEQPARDDASRPVRRGVHDSGPRRRAEREDADAAQRQERAEEVEQLDAQKRPLHVGPLEERREPEEDGQDAGSHQSGGESFGGRRLVGHERAVLVAHCWPPSLRSMCASTSCDAMLSPRTVTNRTTPAANSAAIWSPLAIPYWLAMRLVSVSVP